MAKRQDLRQDENGDIYINPNTGDLSIIESDNQHVSDILQSISGDYKEFPLIGLNLFTYQNSVGQKQRLESEMRKQLLSDGYRVTKVVIPDQINGLQGIEVYADEPNI